MKYAFLLLGTLVLFSCPVHAQSLTIPLTFTNDAATAVVTVGFEPDASDGFDMGLDQLAPPSPPAQLFDVRSIFDNTEYIQDFRDTTSAETLFHIALTQASGSSNFTVEWDSAALATEIGTFEITDDMDGSLFGPIDMKTVGTLDVLASQALLDNGLRIRIELNEGSTVSIDDEHELADRFTLEQNFPNPFAQQTDIGFTVSQTDHVKLVIYDLLGKEKSVLVDGIMAPGAYSYTWDALSEASGMYYYSLSVGSQTSTRSMILAR